MIRNVGMPVGEAILAYGNEDFDKCARLLSQVRYTANHFGGSHAQRDLISQTLIESAIRSGQLNYARALLSERSAKKATSPVTWQRTATVMEQLQLQDQAERARNQAEAILTSSSVTVN